MTGHGARVTRAELGTGEHRIRALPWRSILRRALPQIARIVVVAAVC
jgi:hypothetical protein